MGQGMMTIAFILGLGLLTLFFSGIMEEQRNPNQMPQTNTVGNVHEVKLLRNRQGHYVVTGTINQQPAEFLLDTGATDVVIPDNVANRYGLTRGRPAKAMTANGVVTIYETNIDQLSIGEINLTNVRASINPGMDGFSILLGMSALKHIEFLQQGDSLTLRQRY